MKELIIVRGLPGSGKSTFAEFLISTSETLSVAHYENDKYLIDENGNYVWTPERISDAVKQLWKDFNKSMEANVELIVVSNVFVSEKSVNSFIKAGKKNGYKVTCVIVENRNETKNIHNVPDETLRSMLENFHIKLI